MATKVSIAVASARGVSGRWREQYLHPKEGWTRCYDGDSKIVHEKLCALGRNPDIAAVDALIGNKSWTHLTCNGCGDYVLRAVDFQRHGDALLICEDCLTAGLSAMKGEAP